MHILIDQLLIWMQRLPPSFLTEYNLNLPETVNLRGDDDSGRSWSVKVERMSDGLFAFTHGWPKFAEDAALRLGEFLVFFLLPPSNFNVHIYATSFLQRDIPTPSSPLVDRVAESSKSRRGKRGTPPQPYFEALLKKYHQSRIVRLVWIFWLIINAYIYVVKLRGLIWIACADPSYGVRGRE